MRTMLIALFACSTLLACDTQNSAKLNRPDNGSNNEVLLDDQALVVPSTKSLLRINQRTVSTSADGSVADLELIYSLDPEVRSALKPSSYVKFEYVAADKPSEVVARAAITNELGGKVKISIPTTDESAKLVATISGLLPAAIKDQGVLVVHLPVFKKRETTDLSLVDDVTTELVEGSYESELIDGRRVHRFAVKVFDPTAGPIWQLLSDQEKENTEVLKYSISGLEKNAANYFSAIESNVNDVESPVTVSFTEHPLAVYMVLDKSKSVVTSRQAHNLVDAASEAVIALRQTAEFDYRLFNGQVERISSLRELDFDSGDSSATALYYAIDTALSDIENFGSINQDKVVMVFTDGIDLASRNYYNGDLIDHNQVHEYIVQRVKQVRQAQQRLLGRQLDVYTIGVYDKDSGIDVPVEIQKLDEISEVGGTKTSYNNLNIDSIEDAFKTVVQNIRGVYYLQYSSQQTPDDNKLCLKVSVNGHNDWIQLPTEHEPVICGPRQDQLLDR